MENQAEPQPEIIESKHPGSITVFRNGREEKIPITISKIETRYASGRVDCTLIVPRLSTKVKNT